MCRNMVRTFVFALLARSERQDADALDGLFVLLLKIWPWSGSHSVVGMCTDDRSTRLPPYRRMRNRTRLSRQVQRHMAQYTLANNIDLLGYSYACIGTFGTQRWGPSGMSAPPPEPVARPGYYPPGGVNSRSPEARSSSFGAQRDSGGHRNSFSGSQQYQHRPSGGHYGAPPGAAQPPPAPPAPTQAPPPPKKQPEINLIDDFGPSVSVPAQSLIFDPLAGVSIVSSCTLLPRKVSMV